MDQEENKDVEESDSSRSELDSQAPSRRKSGKYLHNIFSVSKGRESGNLQNADTTKKRGISSITYEHRAKKLLDMIN